MAIWAWYVCPFFLTRNSKQFDSFVLSSKAGKQKHKFKCENDKQLCNFFLSNSMTFKLQLSRLFLNAYTYIEIEPYLWCQQKQMMVERKKRLDMFSKHITKTANSNTHSLNKLFYCVDQFGCDSFYFITLE